MEECPVKGYWEVRLDDNRPVGRDVGCKGPGPTCLKRHFGGKTTLEGEIPGLYTAAIKNPEDCIDPAFAMEPLEQV